MYGIAHLHARFLQGFSDAHLLDGHLQTIHALIAILVGHSYGTLDALAAHDKDAVLLGDRETVLWLGTQDRTFKVDDSPRSGLLGLFTPKLLQTQSDVLDQFCRS